MPIDLWITVTAGFFLAATGLGISRWLYPIVLPQMMESLDLTYGHMGILSAAILIGYLTMSVVSGVLATKFGAKLIIIASVASAGIWLTALGFVSSFPLAFLLMLLLGMSAAGSFIPMTGLMAAIFPPNRRGLFISVMGMGANLGIFLTGFLAPMVLLSYGAVGWRYVWAYFGVAVLISSAGGIFMKARPAGGNNRKPTNSGGLSPSNQVGTTTAPVPVLNWRLVYANRTVLLLWVTYVLHGFYAAYTTFMMAFLTKGLNLSLDVAGNMWFWMGLVSTPTIIIWGVLSDTMGRKRALISCGILLFVGTILPVFSHEVPLLYISMILFGATFTGSMIIILAAAGDAAGATMASAAMGLVTMGHGLGQMIGPALGGFLIDWTGSFYPGFLLAALAIAGEIILFGIIPLSVREEE